MDYLKKITHWPILTLLPLAFSSCVKDHDIEPGSQKTTITVENVLSSQPLVESGTFRGGEQPVILPGESVTIKFSAAKGEALTFATMYGWANDLFFAPENPGILVYQADGTPIEGDVSSQIKLWDNGTRENQMPGSGITRPGVAETKNITEVKGTDAQGNPYLAASALLSASLKYDGDSYFTLTIKNTTGGTINQTPFSPGVWAVSYIVGGNLLNPAPIYTSGQPTANGLTAIAEGGDNSEMSAYLSTITGIFTPLSPILVVVYNGIENPIFKNGEIDRGQGLTMIAQQGNADVLAASLMGKPGIKSVYVLAATTTKVLLPKIMGQPGSSVSQELSVVAGDRIAIATMYGFSNDWFFTSVDNGVDAMMKGDISTSVKLYDDGTAINQFPGAGITQFNLAGTPLAESKVIAEVPNPNSFTTLPAIKDFIHITLQ